MWFLADRQDGPKLGYNQRNHLKKGHNSDLATACNICSIGGRGKLFFWQDLLRFQKSIQIQMSPFFFLTGTILETHLECRTGKIILAFNNLLSSNLI